MFTPEKARKSLPLLLEGNLPHRRARRRSGETPPLRLTSAPPDPLTPPPVAAPAKDIEAAFQRDGEELRSASGRWRSDDANPPACVSPCLCSSACPPGRPAALKVGPRPPLEALGRVASRRPWGPQVTAVLCPPAGGQRQRPASNRQPHLDRQQQQHGGVLRHRGGAGGAPPGAGAAPPGSGTERRTVASPLAG